MNSQKTLLEGTYILELNRFEDERGSLLKTFNSDRFRELGLETVYAECYYSTSKKNVIRGMHFQVPPHDHDKLVHVVEGTIIDVLLDLRKNSPSYKKFFDIELTSENNKAVYIPKGVAHGFKVTSERAKVLYMTSTVHSKESDAGVHWNSFGYDWKLANPILSDKDKNMITLDDFKNPF